MEQKHNRVPSADRRQQIIDIAMRLFAKNGFRGTTTREIAKLAHVNEAILFRHFRYKEDLYWAVVESGCRKGRSHQEFREMLNEAEPREALTAVAEEFLVRLRKDPSMMRLYLFTALENHKLSYRLFRTHALRYHEILADYIRTRIRRGEFRRVDPRLAARSFLGMISQHYQVHELFGAKRFQRFDPHRVSEALTDIWLGGLGARNGNRSRKRQGRNHR
ncbi:MAG: TetR/AcrR family transcriptional regulator [Candidatus Acidiferrales bacterium]